jgi:carbon starvation protein CstA
MNSIIVLILGALGIALGYFWYARRIDRTIVQPDAEKATPAKIVQRQLELPTDDD